jgi:hypothetical protein
MFSYRRLIGIAPLVALAACQTDLSQAPAGPAGPSAAFGRWTPGPTDTCTQEQHDAYAVIGPDGKLYPTWHPAVDPATGCTFGHDHGRDPRGSALYAAVGPIPFGYANEQLDIYNPSLSRHEDHVGHKIEWENDIEVNVGNGISSSLFAVRCDVLTKLHQGTHSKDAFTNNLHELVYHIDCSDGTKMSLTMMAAIGTAGEFVASCDRNRHVTVGTPSPAGSPNGGGHRAIPDRTCMEQSVLVGDGQRSNFGAMRESWETSQSIRTAGGRSLASINPYFQVDGPSRFFDPALPDGVGRPIDVCYETTPTGRRARGGLCDESTADGTIAGIVYDDPQSRFNGADRFVDINSNDIRNDEGPEIWYSDPFGHNASTTAFPGSVRQFIARIDNSRLDLHGPAIGRDRDYGPPGSGVHPPN